MFNFSNQTTIFSLPELNVNLITTSFMKMQLVREKVLIDIFKHYLLKEYLSAILHRFMYETI